MLPEARHSVASALRHRFPVAVVPIWAPFLALIALVPVLFVIRTTSPAGHGKPRLPASVLNSSRLLELAEFDAKAAGLRAEIWTLLEDKHLEIDGPTDFRRILGQARQLLLPWSVRRFQNTTPHTEQILSELVRSIDRTRKYASCAVVGNSGILLDAEYGASIDSHEAVIRVKNAPVDGGLLSRHVGTKTTISFISGHVLHVCYGRRRKQCSCHPYGHAVPLVLYVLHPFHFTAVAGCNSTGVGNIFVTDPVFDRLCLKIVKYYSLRRWFTGGGSRRFSDWSVAHKGERFYYSSGMQAVLMAVGVCERVSLYGFGKSAMSKHHYHTRQKAEVKVHDYEAEYEFYRDLMESPARIPFLSSAVGKFKFPPVAIHGWGPV